MSYSDRIYGDAWIAEWTDKDGILEQPAAQNLNRFADGLNLPRWPVGWPWTDKDGDLTQPAYQWWSRVQRAAGLRRFTWQDPFGLRSLRRISPEELEQAERDLFSCAELSLVNPPRTEEFEDDGEHQPEIAALRSALRLVVRRFLNPEAPVHAEVVPGEERLESSRIRRFLDPGTRRRNPGYAEAAQQFSSSGEILENIPSREEALAQREREEAEPQDDPLPERFDRLGKGVLNLFSDEDGDEQLFPPHDPTAPMFGAQTNVTGIEQMRRFRFFLEAAAREAGISIPALLNIDDADRAQRGLLYKFRGTNPEVKLAQERYYAWSWLPFNPGRRSEELREYMDQIRNATAIPYTADYNEDRLLAHKSQPGLTFGDTAWEPEIDDNYRAVVDENGSVWMEVNVGGMLARSVGDNPDGSLTQEFKPFVFGQFGADGKSIEVHEEGVARASRLGLDLPIVQELADEGVDLALLDSEFNKRLNERYATRNLAEVIGDRYRKYQIDENGPNRERWTPVIPFYERGPTGATREDDVGMFRVFEEEWRLTRQIHRQIFMTGLVVEVAAAWENEDGTISKGPSTLTGGFFGPYLDADPLVRIPPVRFRTPFRENEVGPRKLFPVMRIVGGANQFFLWQGSTGGLLGEFAMTRFGQWLGRNSEAVLVATIVVTLLTLGLGSGGAAAAGGGGAAAETGGGALTQIATATEQAGSVALSQGGSVSILEAAAQVQLATEQFTAALGVSSSTNLAGSILTTEITAIGGQVVGTVSLNLATGAVTTGTGTALSAGAGAGAASAGLIQASSVAYLQGVAALSGTAITQNSLLALISQALVTVGEALIPGGTLIAGSAPTALVNAATVAESLQLYLAVPGVFTRDVGLAIGTINEGLIAIQGLGQATASQITTAAVGTAAAVPAAAAPALVVATETAVAVTIPTAAGGLTQIAPLIGAAQQLAAGGSLAGTAAVSLQSGGGLAQVGAQVVEEIAGNLAAQVGPIPPDPTIALAVPLSSRSEFILRIARLTLNLLQFAFPGGLPHESDQQGIVPAEFDLDASDWFFLTDKDDLNNRTDSAPKEYVPLELPAALPRQTMRGLELIDDIRLANRASASDQQPQDIFARTHPAPEYIPGPEMKNRKEYLRLRKTLAFPHKRKSLSREFFITLFGAREDRAAVADILAREVLKDAVGQMPFSENSLMDGQTIPLTELPARDIGYLFGPWETSRYDLENIQYASRATIPNITTVLKALLDRLVYYRGRNRRKPPRNDPMTAYNRAIREIRKMRTAYVAAQNAGLPQTARRVLQESETQVAVCRRFISQVGSIPPGIRWNFNPAVNSLG